MVPTVDADSFHPADACCPREFLLLSPRHVEIPRFARMTVQSRHSPGVNGWTGRRPVYSAPIPSDLGTPGEHMRPRLLLIPLLLTLIPACARAQGVQQASGRARCAPENGGITLPTGFCATIFADSVPGPRHLLVAPNGDVFVA